MDDLWIKAMDFGAKMGCHQRADRSFYIKGYQLPICARCTGIVLSSPIGYILYFGKKIRLMCGIALCLPMIIDGGIQYLGIKESTNFRRFLTGLLGGIGLSTIRLNVYVKIINMFPKAILTLGKLIKIRE